MGEIRLKSHLPERTGTRKIVERLQEHSAQESTVLKSSYPSSMFALYSFVAKKMSKQGRLGVVPVPRNQIIKSMSITDFSGEGL